MNDIPPRAVLYARVSTDEQEARGTIVNQREHAENFSRLHQIPILDWYFDEAVSGIMPLAKRPQGARLLADARAGKFNLVLITRIDRLARSTLELLRAVEQLEREGAAIRSMTEPIETATPMGRFFLAVLGSMAQLEREVLKVRSRSGMERLARSGRWNGGKPPYGYGVGEGGRLEIDEEQARVVRRIFRLYTEERQGSVRIAALLSAEGVPTPKQAQGIVRRKGSYSGRWTDSTISRILNNPQYVGARIWGRLKSIREDGAFVRMEQAGEAAHITSEIPAILALDTFSEAQRLLTQNFAWSKRNTKHDYLLRGLIRCADCGAMYSGISPTDRKMSSYFHPKKPHCPARRIERTAIEALVWENILLYVHNPERVVEYLAEQLRRESERAAPHEREFGGIEEALAGKQAERRRLIGLARRGVVTEAEAEYELSQLQQEIDALETRRGLLFGHREQSQAAENRILEAPALLREIAKRVNDDSFAARREVVEQLIRGITVERGGEEITIRYCFDAGEGHRPTITLF